MKMLICSIGSSRHKRTLRFASAVARALRAKTTLLGAVHGGNEDELVLLLDATARTMAEEGLEAQFRVAHGEAEEIVLAEINAGDYDLVAVGALGAKRSRRRLLESVGMRIVEQAQTSVLHIKGDRRTLNRVLICASGTEHGHMPIWAGASLTCGVGVSAMILHVADAMPGMYAGLELMEETLTELLRSDTERARELKWAAQAIKNECEISELKLRRGRVAEQILREGQEGDYDLIVIGSSFYSGGLVRMLLGDVTREVVSRANRPVLVVRPPQRKAGSADKETEDRPFE